MLCAGAKSLQSCLTLWLYGLLWGLDSSEPTGSSDHGILLARILEWVAVFSSGRFSRPRDWTQADFSDPGSEPRDWTPADFPDQGIEPIETWVQSLGQENLLEENTATHSSILAKRIPWSEEPVGLQSITSQRVRHDWSDLAQHIAWLEGSRQCCLRKAYTSDQMTRQKQETPRDSERFWFQKNYLGPTSVNFLKIGNLLKNRTEPLLNLTKNYFLIYMEKWSWNLQAKLRE